MLGFKELINLMSSAEFSFTPFTVISLLNSAEKTSLSEPNSLISLCAIGFVSFCGIAKNSNNSNF